MTFWSPADGNLSKFGERVEKSLHSVTGLIVIPKHHCLNSFARVNVEHFNEKLDLFAVLELRFVVEL